jgi:hypothetical protein
VSREAREAPGTLTSLIEEVVRDAQRQAGEEAWGHGLRAGLVIGRYELLREVGRGGFGVVWEARDRDLGRTVAFKALRVRGEAAREQRLLAEAEVAARLSHPNIVTVLDVGRADHGVYLVQEYLTGAPLSQRLAEGRLPLREAVRIATELARGLAHAHAHGVVHRDLTPGNVQLCDDGQVKLLDLGMAAAFGRRKLDGGTPAYMAPEQAAAAPEDERTDVYALGALLYRMLTGQPPVATDDRGVARSGSRGLEVPEAPALAALVEAMLSRSPTERPRDAGVVLEALLELEPTLPRSSAGPSRVRIRRPPRARWIGAGVLFGLGVAGVVALASVLWAHRAGLHLVSGGPAGAAPAALVVSATSATATCSWKQVARRDFETPATDLKWRNGSFRGQAAEMHEGRGAWHQGSDWNQLFIPVGERRPDVFAVDAQFLPPAAAPADQLLGVSLHVFADPVGPLDSSSSEVAHGRGIVLYDAPGKAPQFEWGIPDGVQTRVVAAKGTLGSLARDRWHTLRIEGSRSRCWLRVLLDGAPLLVETGHCDLAGGHVLLGSNGGSYVQADVRWRTFRLFEGDATCQ